MTTLAAALSDEVPADRLLAAVGLTEIQERVYVLLVGAPRLTAAEIAERLDLPLRAVREELTALEADELVNSDSGRPRRYQATPPDIAVPTLVIRRQTELQRARLAAHQLDELARTAAVPGQYAPDMAETLTGADAILRRLDQLQRAAQQQVCSLVRLPVLGAATEPAELPNLARGVAYRAIYDPDAITGPVSPGVLRPVMAAGEQARVFPHVPTKLFLIDSTTALLPIAVHDPAAGTLQIRAPAIVNTLQMFFETIWQQATPLTAPRHGATELGLGESDTETGELIVLLTAGLKDEAIARRLGISPRTLDRRVYALIRSLGARTRFQAGWQAALRFHPSLRPES